MRLKDFLKEEEGEEVIDTINKVVDGIYGKSIAQGINATKQEAEPYVSDIVLGTIIAAVKENNEKATDDEAIKGELLPVLKAFYDKNKDVPKDEKAAATPATPAADPAADPAAPSL